MIVANEIQIQTNKNQRAHDRSRGVRETTARSRSTVAYTNK